MERLRRSSSDNVIFGVCGGIARYFQVDSVFIRIGFAILTIAGGSGLLIYLVMAVIMPKDDESPASGDPPGSIAAHTPDGDGGSRRAQGLAAVLIIAGAVLLLANLGAFSWLDWSIIWPLLLIGIGVLIIAQRYRSPS